MTISDICEKYNIKSTELLDIKNEILKLLKEFHPDNNGGKCDKDYITDLTAALTLIEETISQENYEKNEIKVLSNELAKVLQNNLSIEKISNKSEQEYVEQKYNSSIGEHFTQLKAKTRVKRYSLVSITGVITFLWLLPEKIMSHPIFTYLFHDYYLQEKVSAFFAMLFLEIWLLLLICTILYWIRVFNLEQAEKEVLEKIRLKNVQNDILWGFFRELEETNFSREQFSEYIRNVVTRMITGKICNQKNIMKRAKFSMHLKSELSEEIVQNIADLILLNAEEHKVIQKVEKKSLMDYYTIASD